MLLEAIRMPLVVRGAGDAALAKRDRQPAFLPYPPVVGGFLPLLMDEIAKSTI
jgi:hypothetical protein